MTPSGAVRSMRVLLAFAVLMLSGCLYGFSGGGGLPSNLKSLPNAFAVGVIAMCACGS